MVTVGIGEILAIGVLGNACLLYTSWDKELFEASHVRLPFFLQVSDAVKYDQDCKGPHTTSWHILSPKMLSLIHI